MIPNENDDILFSSIIGRKELKARGKEWIDENMNISLFLRGESGSGKSFLAASIAGEYARKHNRRVHILEGAKMASGMYGEISESMAMDSNYAIVMNEFHGFRKGDDKCQASINLSNYWSQAYSSKYAKPELPIFGTSETMPVFKGTFILTSFLPKGAKGKKGGDDERRAIEWHLDAYSKAELRAIAKRMGIESRVFADGTDALGMLIAASRGYSTVMEKIATMGKWSNVVDFPSFVREVKEIGGAYPHGLNHEEKSIVDFLASNGTTKKTKLKGRTGQDRLAFIQSTNYLEDCGLIFDRSSTEIGITDKGKKWAALVNAAL